MDNITISFALTNYNNSLLSIQAIESILKIRNLVDFFIVIVDNNSEPDEKELLNDYAKRNNIKELLVVFLNENVGYFKGLNVGIETIKNKLSKICDFIIIGNNDLVFPQNLLEVLNNNSKILNQYAVISPNLITLDGVHQNPHVVSDLSIIRRFVYKIYFSNYIFSRIIGLFSSFFGSIVKRKDHFQHSESKEIKMGYGACYILTKTFFHYFRKLHDPVFLMGEEAILSNQLNEKNLKIYYDSDILITHYDHSSIGKIPSKKMWLITKKSYNIYKKLL